MVSVPITYDITGKPIRQDYLVAVVSTGPLSAGTLRKERVFMVNIHGMVLLRDGSVRSGGQCVVLEEPVWPNQ